MNSDVYIKENLVKNIATLVIAVLLYPFLKESLVAIRVEQINDFLLIISMFLVTVCFANFAFTYEKSKMKTKMEKLLAHGTTGVFLLLTALFLESIVLAVEVVYPSLYSLVFIFSALLYSAVVLFDFWDLLRV